MQMNCRAHPTCIRLKPVWKPNTWGIDCPFGNYLWTLCPFELHTTCPVHVVTVWGPLVNSSLNLTRLPYAELNINDCPFGTICYELFVHKTELHTTRPIHVVTAWGQRVYSSLNCLMQIEILMIAPLAQFLLNPLFVKTDLHTTCPVHVVTAWGQHVN
jgi:hypothetical protein